MFMFLILIYKKHKLRKVNTNNNNNEKKQVVYNIMLLYFVNNVTYKGIQEGNV